MVLSSTNKKRCRSKMLTSHKVRLFLIVLALCGGVNTVAAESPGDSYQMSMLFPSDSQKTKAWKKHRVFIFTDVRDKDVDRFMETQFDRIDNAMFVGTVVTDDEGKPMRSEKTGKYLKEDDC